MIDISGHLPPLCYFAKLHLGPIPGPFEWCASVTRKGQVAYIQNACGDMHVKSLRDALEFEHVFGAIMARMGLREVVWLRWTPGGFRENRFAVASKA